MVAGFRTHQPGFRWKRFLCRSVGADNLERPTLAEVSPTPKYPKKSGFEGHSQTSSLFVMDLEMLRYVLVEEKKALAKLSLDQELFPGTFFVDNHGQANAFENPL